MTETNPTPNENYLEGEYLSEPYMSGGLSASFGMQVSQQIVNSQNPLSMQSEQTVNSDKSIGMQVNQIIATASELSMQVNQVIDQLATIGIQVTQTQGDVTKSTGMEVFESNLRHAVHEVYLEGGYMEDSYLAAQVCAFLGMQATQNINGLLSLGMQVNQIIVNQVAENGVQALQTIDQETLKGMQANMVAIARYGMQTTQVIYNTTQLRLMCEFPSRGLSSQNGDNWTATSTALGDYAVKNLNTDIIEQVYRSASNVATLECDTGVPQGVPLDTIAILGHNLTRSAIIQVQGSQNGTFSPPDKIINITATLDNTTWISPELPKSDGQNRYWRFIIQDPSNPDGFLQIGTILFGASTIFTTSENFTNPLTSSFVHFKDSVNTEGFTNKMNDRALKKTLSLNFDNLQSLGGNFKSIEDMAKFARTSLKCLIIPIPSNPDRYSVFAKLSAMPDYEVTATDNQDLRADHVSFSLNWDESL